MHETAALRIQLFGAFRLWVGERSIDPRHWRLHKAATLLKLLALTPDHRLLRDLVMGQLWPDRDQAAAVNNLHQILHVARHALSEAAPGQKGLILDTEYLVLWPDGPILVDVEAFEAAAVRARQTQDPADYHAALALASGELLPENRYDDWAGARRQSLIADQIRLRLELAQLHEQSANEAAAVDTLVPVLQLDSACERAHVALMRLYARLGDRQGALRQFGALREALARELAAEPAVASVRLYHAILSDQFPNGVWSESRVSPILSPAPPHRPRANLPTPLTGFIGRDDETRTLTSLLTPADDRRPSTRLLTLTGAGGVGKTRLALHVARELLTHYPQGVWFIDLAPLRDPAQIAATCCATLELRQADLRDPQDALVHFLRERRALVILDHCEHMVQASADLVAVLLHNCPDLTVLAASRESLGLTGETVFRIPPLATPDPRRWTLAELNAFDAVQLFLTRAREAGSTIELNDGNASAVVHVCAQLDGIPLALELAAARMSALSVNQIASRLTDRFRILRDDSRTPRSRHQTLRAMIDWSHALLLEPERLLLRRLSVFSGGWTLEAALAVGGESDGDELLARLVNKSLVSFEPEPEPRYRMLETIRQYAAEKLAEARELDAARDRLLRFLDEWTARAEPWLRSAHAVTWMNRLDVDLANLRAALAWAAETDPEAAVRMAANLLWFWHIRNHALEGIEWLRRALAAHAAHREGGPPRDEDAVLRARGLNALAALLWFTTGAQEASDHLEESRRLLEDRGPSASRILAHTYLRLGGLTQATGEARALIHRGLALAHEAGDTFQAAEGYCLLSLAESRAGEYVEALRRLDAAAERFGVIGDRDGEATIALYRGHCYLALRDWGRALSHYERAQACYRSINNVSFEHISADFQAGARFWLGDPAGARAIWDDVRNAAQAGGDRLLMIRGSRGTGLVDWVEGDRASASAHIRRVLDLVAQSGLEIGGGAASLYHFLGNIALSAGDDQEAAACYDAEALTAPPAARAVATILSACGLARVALERDNGPVAVQSVQRALSAPMGPAALPLRLRAADAHAQLWAGRVALARGDIGAARALLAEALSLQPIHDSMSYDWEISPLVAHARLFESFALLSIESARQGRPVTAPDFERATRLMAASVALHDVRYAMSPRERADHDRGRETLLEALGSAGLDHHWAEGQGLALEDARAQCLDVRVS